MFLCESKLPHVVSSDCKALHIPHHSTLYHLNASSAMPQVKSKLDFKRFQVMDDGSTWGAHGKHEAMPAPPTTALARLMSRQASHGSHGAQTCHVSYPVAVSLDATHITNVMQLTGLPASIHLNSCGRSFGSCSLLCQPAVHFDFFQHGHFCILNVDHVPNH